MLAKIGELLIKDDFISQDQLDHCLEYKKMNPKDRLGSILKHHGFINDYELATCLSKQIGWKFFKSDYIADYRAIQQVGLDYFCEHQIFPLKNGGIPSFVVSIIYKVENKDLGFTELTFGNGVKVVIKKTDFKNDEILLRAYGLGGTSLYPDNIFPSAFYASNIINESGIGNFDNTELEKKLKSAI